jgi:hypothetical protein
MLVVYHPSDAVNGSQKPRDSSQPMVEGERVTQAVWKGLALEISSTSSKVPASIIVSHCLKRE